MGSRGGRHPDILFQPGDIEVSNVKGDAYLVYGSAAPRGPLVSIDEVGGNLYLLDSRQLDREMGADAVMRGALVEGMASHRTTHELGCFKIATPTCEKIIIVNYSFSSCKIGRVVGDFVPVNGHLPAFLSIQRWEGRFFCGVSEGMLPNPSLLFVCKTLKKFMNKDSLSPYANETLRNRRKTLPAPPPTHIAAPRATPKPAAPVTPRQDTSTTAKVSHASSSYLSEGEIPPESIDSQPPSRPAAPPSGPRMRVLPFTEGIKAPQTWTADPTTVICGNCKSPGHQVRECIGPVDALGFINACPVCNTSSHHLETCPVIKGLAKSLKKKLYYQMLCVWRQNKPPMRSNQCWVTFCTNDILPPIPASESFEKFQHTWKGFKYGYCYGNPNLNRLVLPVNAITIPKPGSEACCEKSRRQKLAMKAESKAISKTESLKAAKAKKEARAKSLKEAAAKAKNTLISTNTQAKALKRKALAPLDEQKAKIKKQKFSSTPALPIRTRISAVPQSLDTWAGDWLARTFPVKQETEPGGSMKDSGVTVKQEPCDE